MQTTSPRRFPRSPLQARRLFVLGILTVVWVWAAVLFVLVGD